MPVSNYKIVAWGTPVGQGVSGAQYVNLSGVAKTNSQREPNVVASELIAARLGQAILLPIPPAFIVDRDGAPWFVSLDFNLAGESLPPVSGSEIATTFPSIAAGIILFDVWIMNKDRHCGNLAYHRATERLQVFDHSRALMPHQNQRTFAEAHRTRLAIGQRHCLAPHIVDAHTFSLWFERIQAVPTYYLKAALEDAVEVGFRPDNVNFFLDLLVERRERIPQLIENNMHTFSALQVGLGSPILWR